jgi:hypothetical protein
VELKLKPKGAALFFVESEPERDAAPAVAPAASTQDRHVHQMEIKKKQEISFQTGLAYL